MDGYLPPSDVSSAYGEIMQAYNFFSMLGKVSCDKYVGRWYSLVKNTGLSINT